MKNLFRFVVALAACTSAHAQDGARSAPDLAPQFIELANTLRRGTGAADQAKVDSYLRAAQQLPRSEASVFHRFYATQVAIVNAFRTSTDAAPETVAQILHGRVAAKGDLPVRGGDITVEANADHCYSVVSYMDFDRERRSGTSVHWTAPNQATLQPFLAPMTERPNNDGNFVGLHTVFGFCTREAQRVTATFQTLINDSSRLQYVAVETTRAQLPYVVALTLRPQMPVDVCNPDGYARFFSQPIPGSIAYWRTKPRLIAGHIISNRVDTFDLDGTAMDLYVNDLSETPTGALDVGDETPFPGRLCLYEDPSLATSQETMKLAQCIKKIDKKYAPQIQRQQAIYDNALTSATAEAASRRIDELSQRNNRDLDTKCGTLYERAEARWNTVMEQARREFAARPYQSTVPRLSELLLFSRN